MNCHSHQITPLRVDCHAGSNGGISILNKPTERSIGGGRKVFIDDAGLAESNKKWIVNDRKSIRLGIAGGNDGRAIRRGRYRQADVPRLVRLIFAKADAAEGLVEQAVLQ